MLCKVTKTELEVDDVSKTENHASIWLNDVERKNIMHDILCKVTTNANILSNICIFEWTRYIYISDRHSRHKKL